MVCAENTIQIRDTYNPIQSQIIKVGELIDNPPINKSILTPKGFIPFQLEKYQPQHLYKINLIAKGTDKHTLLLSEESFVVDFMENNYLAPYQVKEGTNILLYTNTDTDCRGFHIKRCLSIVSSVERLDGMHETYKIVAAVNRVWVDRAECKV